MNKIRENLVQKTGNTVILNQTLLQLDHELDHVIKHEKIKVNGSDRDYTDSVEKFCSEELSQYEELKGFSVSHTEIENCPRLYEVGRLRDTTLITVFDCVNYLMKGGYGFVLMGLTQTDKTRSEYVTACLYAVMRWIKCREVVIPIIITPGTNGIVQQYIGKANAVYHYLSSMNLSYRGVSLSINKCLENNWCKLNNLIENQKKLSHKDKQFLRKQFEGCAASYGIPILRLSKDSLNLFNNFLTLGRGNFETLLVRDEKHHSAGPDSDHTKSIDLRLETEGDRTIASLLRNDNAGLVKSIWCSASPSGMQEAYDKKIYVRISDHYYGFPELSDLGDIYKIQNHPVVESLNSYRDLGDDNSIYIEDIRAKCYLKENHFNKMNRHKRYKSHKDYQDKFENFIRDLLEHLWQSGQHGILFRFFNSNGLTDTFIRNLMPKLKTEFLIIKNYADKAQEPAKNVISGSNPDNKKYVVFVTGGGRMADSYPGDCLCGIDFTEKSSTKSAIIQGIVGRMTGYKNGQPLVILTDENKKVFDDIINRTSGLKRLSHDISHGKDNTVNIWKKDYPSGHLLNELFIKGQQKILNEKINGKYLRQLGAEMIDCLEIEFFGDFLTSEQKRFIESEKKCTLLDADELDKSEKGRTVCVLRKDDSKTGGSNADGVIFRYRENRKDRPLELVGFGLRCIPRGSVAHPEAVAGKIANS